jgi:hypothetical protein
MFTWWDNFCRQVQNDYAKEVINNPPKKNLLSAVSYDVRFIETNEDTIQCSYDTHLTCNNINFDENVREFMKLDEIQMNKTIYFHDSACNTKVIVNNMNATKGEVCVNLSYLQ